MGRVSAEQAELNRQHIRENAFEIVAVRGLHEAKFKTIGDSIDKPLSTVQGAIGSSKRAMGQLLSGTDEQEGYALPYVMDRLSFDSGEAFIGSFVEMAKTDAVGRGCLLMFANNIYGIADRHYSNDIRVAMLTRLAQVKGVGKTKAVETLETAYGKAMVAMLANPLSGEVRESQEEDWMNAS
ncbi:hypothetical protein [Vibrio sp. WXL210]|uniref:hypothetical protein n=1 Tax=Vibrio sp. WXL210 TaxID=3450709 RepID=UPI003EC6FE2F